MQLNVESFSPSHAIAPFPVFLDASASTSKAVEYPFHQISHTWIINGSASISGPLGAMLIDRPGTHSAGIRSKDSYDPGLTTIEQCFSVDAISEDEGFPGNSTVRINSAEQPCLDEIIRRHAASNKRILLQGKFFAQSECSIPGDIENFRLAGLGQCVDQPGKGFRGASLLVLNGG